MKTISSYLILKASKPPCTLFFLLTGTSAHWLSSSFLRASRIFFLSIKARRRTSAGFLGSGTNSFCCLRCSPVSLLEEALWLTGLVAFSAFMVSFFFSVFSASLVLSITGPLFLSLVSFLVSMASSIDETSGFFWVCSGLLSLHGVIHRWNFGFFLGVLGLLSLHGAIHRWNFVLFLGVRAWLAHGACKFYRWERSYSITTLRQLPPRLVRVLLVQLQLQLQLQRQQQLHCNYNYNCNCNYTTPDYSYTTTITTLQLQTAIATTTATIKSTLHYTREH